MLIPLAEVFADIHSGGSSLDYIPNTGVHEIGNADYDARSLAALVAFGGDIGLVVGGVEVSGFAGMSAVSAVRHGAIAMGGVGRVR